MELGSYVHNGINKENIENAPSFEEVAQKIINFIGTDSCFVGYNIKNFDIPFLYNKLKSVNCKFDFTKLEIVDVLDIENNINGLDIDSIFKRYFDKSRKECKISDNNNFGQVKTSIMVAKKQLEKIGCIPQFLTNDNFLTKTNVSKFQFVMESYQIDSEDNVLCFNVGKYKGCSVGLVYVVDSDYIKWVLSNDFCETTKQILKDFLGI